MTLITSILTVLCAFALPIFVELKHISHKLWDIFISIQKTIVRLAKQFFWPWIVEFLNLINFESIKILYNDLKSEKYPDECVKNYLDRSSYIEYVFILALSLGFSIKMSYLMSMPIEYLINELEKETEYQFPFYSRIVIYPVYLRIVYNGTIIILQGFQVLQSSAIRNIYGDILPKREEENPWLKKEEEPKNKTLQEILSDEEPRVSTRSKKLFDPPKIGVAQRMYISKTGLDLPIA